MASKNENQLLASALSPLDDLPSVLMPSVPILEAVPVATLQPHLAPVMQLDVKSSELITTSSIAPPKGVSNQSRQAESFMRRPKGKYVVPSDINAQINLANLGSPSIVSSTISAPFLPPPPGPSTMETMVPSTANSDFSSNFQTKPASFEAIADNPPVPLGSYHPVIPHWFFCETKLTVTTWHPFSFTDSLNIEEAFRQGSPNVVPTDGGRYDVNVSERQKIPVYWDAKPRTVHRCSWFRKDFSGPLPVPYSEDDANKLEKEYKDAMTSGRWHRQVVMAGGERVMINSPTFIQHYDFQESTEFPNTVSLADAQQTPQVVRRGADDFTIPDCSADKVDHLMFMIHGIGSFCDLSFRGVEECVDDFRKLGEELLASHFKESIDAGQIGRIEILPISWHKALHGDATGIDNKLKLITLRSIPKFREFTNDTLLDVLFFTSPVYGQHIMDTVASEMERLLNIFKDRHPTFGGNVSLGGHSLGSVILFDLLLHQKPCSVTTSDEVMQEKEDSVGEKENGWVKVDSKMETSSPSTSKVNFEIGTAGTGQPAINYPQLSFEPQAVFLMGAPVGMFVTVRGLDMLGPDFKLPTCSRVFNIFHPFDPVAYRIETLIDPSLTELRPVLIPHHKGRKRMHLELKDTIERVGSDIKNRIFDSIQATWNTMYQLYSGDFNTVNQAIDDDLMADDMGTSELGTPQVSVGKLNGGRRIDYVLQEKPYESFTEYIFALQAHLTYWTSEDTLLMILKELYSIDNISCDVTIQAKKGVKQPLLGPRPSIAEMAAVTSQSEKSYSTPSLLQLAKDASAPMQPCQGISEVGDKCAEYNMPSYLRPPTGPSNLPPPMAAIPTQPFEPLAPGSSTVAGIPPPGMPLVISGRPVFDPSIKPTLMGVDPTASPAASAIGPPPKLPMMSFKKK